jgi:type IV secretion system protein VirB9
MRACKAAIGLCVGTLLATTGVSLALERPVASPADIHVRAVVYAPYNVVRIVGSIRSSVQIEVAADEDIAYVALGNTVAWEVAVAGNILFLKAREMQPPTNAQIVTTRADGSKRSYQLELTVLAEDAVGIKPGAGDEPQPYYYVKFRYPADEAAARAKLASDRTSAAAGDAADRMLAADALRGPRNWRYTARGSKAIEPASVWDNGKLTSFVFPGNAEVPAIYIVNTDGSESLAPKSVEGGEVVVHAVAESFVLRRGADVLGVYNEGFFGSGVNPGTNTTSPDVARIVDGKAVHQAQARQGVPKGQAALASAATVNAAIALPDPAKLRRSLDAGQQANGGEQANTGPSDNVPAGWAGVVEGNGSIGGQQ